MLHTARRLLTGPLLAAALGAGLTVAPQAAGAAAKVTATVKVSGTLQVRSEPSLKGAAVGTVRGGQKITVACQVTGQKVRGSVRTTTAWDRLGTGRYVSHAYVAAGHRIPVCAAASPVAVPIKAKPVSGAAKRFVVGTVKSAEGKVNIRSGPSTTAPVVNAVVTGRKINLLCAVTGPSVTGTVRTTTQWDRTSVGTYISHAYMYSGPLKACAGATVPATPAVALTPEQFIRASVAGAQRGWREYGVPPSVTMAQAILESGWGRSSLSTVDKNYFGIKCQNGSYGKLANGCHTYVTDECTKAGKCFTTTGVFRTYATQARSFRDHGSFLRVNPRYAGAFEYTKDANKFIWAVWKAGYATDPNYYTKVTGLMATWNLYQYDTWE
ncbi:sporangiospore maturation cell wall hydrolase GsmA [Actinoplanes sp. N902-109]|uniref:sporangiospore maturation cell wall hydrolase GsmA n=1 Tax=Actinoplanes sp. (strain N902-109) TaxID=649831 RepID=UPI0003295D93|nr:sporangiospore maturation cell wall hydrolase GsmA [Actinoplanes sp. N902-109]AGL18705.1 mannosyl-glycoprotein endo-beta-N-acetylglucosamidase [Actinoplanes sp. N902-109]